MSEQVEMKTPQSGEDKALSSEKKSLPSSKVTVPMPEIKPAKDSKLPASQEAPSESPSSN